MKEPINQESLNRVLLKPRFKIPVKAGQDELGEKFKTSLKSDYPNYRSKVIGNHIVVDVPQKEETFWSPQLHAEVIEEEDGVYVKGILGPKPKVWTFFMFLHFAVAVAFFVFFVIFYTNWSLNQEYGFGDGFESMDSNSSVFSKLGTVGACQFMPLQHIALH